MRLRWERGDESRQHTWSEVVWSLMRFRRAVRGVFGGVPCSEQWKIRRWTSQWESLLPAARSSTPPRSVVGRLRAVGGVKRDSGFEAIDETDYRDEERETSDQITVTYWSIRHVLDSSRWEQCWGFLLLRSTLTKKSFELFVIVVFIIAFVFSIIIVADLHRRDLLSSHCRLTSNSTASFDIDRRRESSGNIRSGDRRWTRRTLTSVRGWWFVDGGQGWRSSTTTESDAWCCFTWFRCTRMRNENEIGDIRGGRRHWRGNTRWSDQRSWKKYARCNRSYRRWITYWRSLIDRSSS